MSEALGMDAIIKHAKEQEKKWDWLGAAKSYQEALLSQKDRQTNAAIREREGYALYRAARQSDTSNEFRGRMNEALASYGKAKEFYEDTKDGSTARKLRCESWLAYINYWLALDVAEKEKLVSEAWKLASAAFKLFRDQEEATECARTYNQLSEAALLGCTIEWDPKNIEATNKSAIETGDEAIQLASRLADNDGLSSAYARTAQFLSNL